MALLTSSHAIAATVCIDPGHGGSDPGAQGCGLSEAEINLSVSLKLRDLLEANGITTYMTRDADTYVGLAERAAYANSKGVDRFASIHSNAGGGTGIETYCMQGSTSSSNGWKMASAIQNGMLGAWPLTDRGVKTANFAVLRDTAMPATLSELAFIDMCSPDAEYLGDDGHRNNAACAHLEAVTSHLGLSGSCSSSAVQHGTAMGAIFEDTGAGTDDMSIRLPGATAVVVETNDSAVAGQGDALFSFTLEAGTYTIQASMDGYASRSVSCVVTANETTWCSIGLTHAVADAGLPPVDADTPPDAAVGPVDAGHIGIDAAPGADAGSDAGSGAGSGASPPAAAYWNEEGDGGCGCTAAGSRSVSYGGWALFGLGLLLLRRRRPAVRRRRAVRWTTGAIAVLLLLGCDEDAQLPAGGKELGTTASAVSETTPRLTSPRKVAEAGHWFPVLSPDGQWVAVTQAGLRGLWIASTQDARLTNVSHAPRSGYMPRWRGDSAVLGFRSANAKDLTAFVDLQTRPAPSFVEAQAVSAWQTDDDRIMVRVRGEASRIDEGADKYFAPVVSHDGRWVAYTGINLGIHVYQVEGGTTVQLGRGTHPSMSADGRWLAFEKTDDDGHVMTDGDLYLCDLEAVGFPVVNLTRTPDTIERTPSLSSDGSMISYATADGVFVAEVAR